MTPQQRRRAKRMRDYEVARQIVIERAGGLCERCGAMGTDIHHVYGRVGDLLTDTSKMILLCHPCHDEAHADLKSSRVELMGILDG